MAELSESDASLPPSDPPSDAGQGSATDERAPSSWRLLFLPLVLVAATILIWTVLRWSSRDTVSPRDLVQNLGQPGKSHWQQAYALAELLGDPQSTELRQDVALAADLADLLQRQLDAAESDANRINLRIFLCRALGEFTVPTGLPALIRAGAQERTPADIAVRKAALEAIAALADQVGVRNVRGNETVVETFIAATRERGPGMDQQTPRSELRASAAFGLGVLGGERSIQELRRLLDDPSPNVRYNAATGLARHGHRDAIPALIEMLDPNNPAALVGEVSAPGKAWKQSLVLTNAIRAASQLAERNPDSDCRSLAAAMEKLIRADVAPTVRSQARLTLEKIRPK